MLVCFNKIIAYMNLEKKLIKRIILKHKTKFNNSVKKPEEAGLIGSGPRENQFIYLYPDKFARIRKDLVACRVIM